MPDRHTDGRRTTVIRSTRLLGAVLLAAVLLVAGPPDAAAAPASADQGLVRLALLSPDTPAGDVYVDSVDGQEVQLTFPGAGYGTVSEYRELPAGTYAISMRPAGATTDGPPILSATVDVEPGSARTVAGVGSFSDLRLEVLVDDLGPPPPGQARLRVVDAAAAAGTLDVALADGPVVATGVAFPGTTGYVDVPAGPATVQVTPSGGDRVEVPLDVPAGSVLSVLVLDRPDGGLTVRPVLDAAGSPVVPRGGVETGAGGTAPAPAPGPAVGAGLAAAGAVALLLGARRRRG